jgi:hypothetical protein
MHLGQLVWYMNDGRPHSAKVLSIMKVENLHENWIATKEQDHFYARFGKARRVYATVHGEFEDVYESKDALLASLC